MMLDPNRDDSEGEIISIDLGMRDQRQLACRSVCSGWCLMLTTINYVKLKFSPKNQVSFMKSCFFSTQLYASFKSKLKLFYMSDADEFVPAPTKLRKS